MAVYDTYDPDWDTYYEYHDVPFRDTFDNPTVNRQAVPIGRNSKCKAAHLDLSGFIIRPSRFNSLHPNYDQYGYPTSEPYNTLDHLNLWNSGHWPGFAITPQHVVVCGHFFVGNSQQSPFSFEGPWPWDDPNQRKIAFMNAEGEYFVHDWELADEDAIGEGTSTILGGGDNVLLKLTTPIPADSGIKIYDKNTILDNDQQFATIYVLDPQGKISQNVHQGFEDTERYTQDGSYQYTYIDPSTPPAIKVGGVATAYQMPALFTGDSGSPAFIHSRSKGTMIYGDLGGWIATGIRGPLSKGRMESFQSYLEEFNAENGTDYTYDYEVITDAITDIAVPPQIDQLECVTTSTMRSRYLACEVTVDGYDEGGSPQTLTKRSTPLVERGVIRRPTISSTTARPLPSPILDTGGSQAGDYQLDPEARWDYENDLKIMGIFPYDFLACPYIGIPTGYVESGNCTLEEAMADPRGRYPDYQEKWALTGDGEIPELSIPMPKPGTRPWQPITDAQTAMKILENGIRYDNVAYDGWQGGNDPKKSIGLYGTAYFTGGLEVAAGQDKMILGKRHTIQRPKYLEDYWTTPMPIPIDPTALGDGGTGRTPIWPPPKPFFDHDVGEWGVSGSELPDNRLKLAGFGDWYKTLLVRSDLIAEFGYVGGPLGDGDAGGGGAVPLETSPVHDPMAPYEEAYYMITEYKGGLITKPGRTLKVPLKYDHLPTDANWWTTSRMSEEFLLPEDWQGVPLPEDPDAVVVDPTGTTASSSPSRNHAWFDDSTLASIYYYEKTNAGERRSDTRWVKLIERQSTSVTDISLDTTMASDWIVGQLSMSCEADSNITISGFGWRRSEGDAAGTGDIHGVIQVGFDAINGPVPPEGPHLSFPIPMPTCADAEGQTVYFEGIISSETFRLQVGNGLSIPGDEALADEIIDAIPIYVIEESTNTCSS